MAVSRTFGVVDLLWTAWMLASIAHTLWSDDNIEHVALKYEEGNFYEGVCETPRGAAAPLPRPMRFRRVSLSGCPPPSNASYKAALAAVNVTVLERLELFRVPGEAAITAGSFAGLGTLDELRMDAVDPLAPSEDFLSPLASLRSLTLTRVAAARLPRLDELRLRRAGVASLPPAAFDAVVLEVVEPSVTSLAPLPRCERLRELTLAELQADLPEGLVQSCGALQWLSISGLRARTLPRGLLRGATRLRGVNVTGGALRGLPGDLLAYAPKLLSVDLSGNQLEELPSDLFSGLPRLERVSVADNRLSAHQLRAFRDVTNLRVFSAAGNPLGDLCEDDQDSSMLSNLKHLEELDLTATNLTRVCPDWLRAPALVVLRLTRNRVRALSCPQLRAHAAPALLDLTGNPVLHVHCTREDFERADGDDSVETELLSVRLDSRLSCDCGAYWLARAMRERAPPARLDPRCAAASTSAGVIAPDTPLRRAPLSALACALPATRCARRCACELAPHAGGVRATCLGPHLPVEELDKLASGQGLQLVELRARNAGITVLSANLPPSLRYLDLEDNNITRGSSDAAADLFAGGRRVRLAGNPLGCGCANRPLLDVLRAHRHLVAGYDSMTCADGRRLEPVTDALMCGRARGGYSPGALAALAGAALASVILVALIVGGLARPESRLRLKALLHARGVRGRWLARRLSAPDPARLYDAFVSHAEEDERFVAEQIVPRLEPKWRLCLSYRDWPAGAWIPAAIDASVARARRTLCVVTPRALASRWARAELRAAHAHALRENTPRMILILVDVPPQSLQADEDLRAAAAAHARLRWGERCFWQKLAYALPDPRPAPTGPIAIVGDGSRKPTADVGDATPDGVAVTGFVTKDEGIRELNNVTASHPDDISKPKVDVGDATPDGVTVTRFVKMDEGIAELNNVTAGHPNDINKLKVDVGDVTPDSVAVTGLITRDEKINELNNVTASHASVSKLTSNVGVAMIDNIAETRFVTRDMEDTVNVTVEQNDIGKMIA